MKRVKCLIKTTMMLLVLCSIVCLTPHTVKASESKEGFTTLNVTAKVPKQYDGEIAFVFTQKDSGFNYSLLLSKDNKYKGELSIVGGLEYTAKVTVKKDTSSYKVTGLNDSYKVKGKKVGLTFEVKKGVTAIESTQDSANTNKEQSSVDTENLNPQTTSNSVNDTTLPEPQQIYSNYIDAVSFIDNNSDFDKFLNNYDNNIMKKYFLSAESTNTEDDWKQMSKYDKFNYYILFVRTKTLITGENSVSSEETLLNELSSESVLLNAVPDGDKVLEAIKTVWRYEWNYYQETGNFINLYDPYTKGSAKKYEEIELTDEEETEIKQAQEELSSENKDTTGSRFKSGIKNNLLSIIILIIVAIALVIAIIIRRKKNYDNIDLD